MGEHLRKVRLDRGLSQKEAARAIGVSHKTYEYWETSRTRAAAVRHWPAILAFLGYDPRPAADTFGARVRAAREAEGLSERELARQLGLDPATVGAWERDAVRRPFPRIRAIFERYMEQQEDRGLLPPGHVPGPGVLER